jgi:ribosomal protein L16 Arg81 hydroxylase
MTVAEILAPLEVAEFMRDYVGRRPAIIEGVPGRFHHLVTWSELNDALSRVRADNERVLLIKNARPIPSARYLVSFGREGVTHVNGPALAKEVAEGATLVVAKVDELLPGIRRVAESCERRFHIYAGVNLYAGWRTDNAFDVHWDKHDTLILQVKGQKDWKVWAPTREHPLADEPIGTPPEGEPYWQGVLHDGDVLYMPRGWWHVAHPRNQLSLHVTIGLKHPTGIDLLAWVMERARESVQARSDVPHWSGAEEQEVWLQTMRDLCASVLSAGAIDRYLETTTAKAHARPIVRLRDTMSAMPALHDLTRLRLTSGSRLEMHARDGDGMISFRAAGADWHCSAALRPALTLLNHVEPHTLQEMRTQIDAVSRPLLRPFMAGLHIGGVIWAEPDDTVA